MTESRAYTEDEIRDMFLRHIASIVLYWHKESRAVNSVDKMTGVVHSILAMIDGCNIGLPGFKIIPDPHEDDKEYHKSQNENWFPDNVDIGGGLHEVICQYYCDEIKDSTPYEEAKDPSPDDLEVLSAWPSGTVGHNRELSYLYTLMGFGKDVGWGRLLQMVQNLNEIYEYPSTIEKFKKAREARIKSLKGLDNGG